MCHHVSIHVCHNVYVDMFTLLRHHVCIHLYHNVHDDCITFIFINVCNHNDGIDCTYFITSRFVFTRIVMNMYSSRSTLVGITLVTHMAQNV